MLVKVPQLELDMGQWTDSKSGKEQVKAIYCCPAYLTSVQRTPWKNKNLDEAQVRNKIYVGDMNNLSYPNDKHWNDRRNIVIKAPLDESIICFKYRHLKWDSSP